MLLHLETATAVCSAALSHNGQIIGYRESAEPRAHAAVLTVFIEELLAQAGIEATAVDAVCISSGPGSYTGLRIASSVAKGFCYAAQKPLLAIDTLSIMAAGFTLENKNISADALLCPMIDARRSEVYTAIYNNDLATVLPPAPMVLDEQSLAEYLQSNPIYFMGDGVAKFEAMISGNSNANFHPTFYPKASHQVHLAQAKFAANAFEDIAYFEPNYLKEFYSGK